MWLQKNFATFSLLLFIESIITQFLDGVMMKPISIFEVDYFVQQADSTRTCKKFILVFVASYNFFVQTSLGYNFIVCIEKSIALI